MEENEQQSEVTPDLNKKRKRNNEDDEKEGQSKHMEKLIELVKEQTEQNEHIIKINGRIIKNIKGHKEIFELSVYRKIR